MGCIICFSLYGLGAFSKDAYVHNSTFNGTRALGAELMNIEQQLHQCTKLSEVDQIVSNLTRILKDLTLTMQGLKKYGENIHPSFKERKI